MCTLKPGDTARRFSECSSRSSSRRRLLDFFSPSAAVGGNIDCGVEARDVHPRLMFSAVIGGPLDADMIGESMLISSLIAEDSARGKLGGGGVWAKRWFQKPWLIELRFVFNEPKAPNSPLVVELSRLMLISLSSSGTPSRGPSSPGTVGRRPGEECAVPEGRSISTSFSRTCRMISASRRVSLSTGAASSNNSALIRPNCRDLGCSS